MRQGHYSRTRRFGDRPSSLVIIHPGLMGFSLSHPERRGEFFGKRHDRRRLDTVRQPRRLSVRSRYGFEWQLRTAAVTSARSASAHGSSFERSNPTTTPNARAVSMAGVGDFFTSDRAAWTARSAATSA